MESATKKKGKNNGKIIQPLLIGMTNESQDVTSYILRAYDRFMILQNNFCIALEVLVKFYQIFKIKGGKEVNLFISFWLQCMGLEEKSAVTKSLLAKMVTENP